MAQKKQQFNVYLTDEQKLAVIDIAGEMHARLGPTIRHLVLLGLEQEQRRFGHQLLSEPSRGPVDHRSDPRPASRPQAASPAPLPSPAPGQDPFGDDDVRMERS